ncbi:MAG: hypothetical protein M3O71_27970 [Bacteroidota bacterium]|nr:hypothetical protein [Bacteroidota bacterium]
MSKRLEDFMKTNREEFDDLEPSADLWSKIEMHLPPQYTDLKKQEKKTFSLGFVLRVAASVIVVMGIGFAFYLNHQEQKPIDLASINPVYAQQQIQYTSLIESKRSELKSFSKTDPNLYKEFSGEIAKMDSTYKELKDDLKDSPNQERVLRAMIKNLQIQTQVLNQQLNVIQQLKEQKKEQSNDTKNI